MAEVSLHIGGRSYGVHCRDGDESNLIRLARVVDAKVEVARSSAAGLTEVRQLLFAALFLADELTEAKAAPPPGDDPVVSGELERLAERIERLADRLSAPH